ncbi:UDP-xylose and UDP-N-acetylglucosamine transporter-like [Sinocyclocheilus grahami]|uniref:UDP-xylose and UDP-N-acetylglucosamine transporter-like n=1 Tax=Sinocyclocheilus grahami TaxID=75366 RepID=UPI0007AC6699|nr:PREDICTED: UDP-xylose and UDP-N-acetylglucosamine transporter-like [Sinocyclocheilus grahami]
MSTLFAIALVFVGCCSNVVFLELLVRDFPGCGNIVTFAQFAFIALEGFIFETNFGRKKPHIPLRIPIMSSPVEVPVIGLSVPVMWLYLLMNVITQYVCIRGVFILTTECASLTVTLVVTLRKFLSLIISILYFHNPFTAWHWVGTAVVFLGTLLYTEVWSSVRAAVKGEKADKKAE